MDFSFFHNKPFALMRKGDTQECQYFNGTVSFLENLEDIPRVRSKRSAKRVYDTLSIIPYAQIRERGYNVRDDGCKIVCMQIEQSTVFSLEELSSAFPQETVTLDDGIQYTTTDEEYKTIVKTIIDKEIGNGEGANFVIPRRGHCVIQDFSPNKALSIFLSILKNEIGAYISYLVYDGERFFLGASPEKHVSIENGRVKMNPISGTFRKQDSYRSTEEFKNEFIPFLKDKKEINELFMVVDEELKMMAQICSGGGMIIGPLLKEMSRLIHTEYLLAGDSDKDIIDILRESMFAATVMGGPLENAANIVYKYEPEGRRYYGGAIALIGRDADGEFLDSPILIRSFEIDAEGRCEFRVGATLVRDSDPAYELEETKRKINGVLQNLTSSSPLSPHRRLDDLRNDEDIPEILQSRNQQLSTFWFFNQQNNTLSLPEMKDKKVVIMDNEDDFCYMQKHMFTRMGLHVDVTRYSSFDLETSRDYDLVVVGPGTGNPNDTKNPKMKKVHEVVEVLLQSKQPFLSICLGNQVLCRVLGIAVNRKEETFQGVPKQIDFFGSPEVVGFYNTFAGFINPKKQPEDLSLSFNEHTGEVYAVKDTEKRFMGLQFHPESILTQNGYHILVGVVRELLSPTE